MADDRLLEAIQSLVDRNTSINSPGSFIDALKAELGNWGRRHLGQFSLYQLDALYDRYTQLKQPNACLSPFESNQDNDFASSSRSDWMGKGSPVATTDRSQHPRGSFHSQGSRPNLDYEIINIELLPANSSQRNKNGKIKSARRDRERTQSLVDPRTA